MASVTRNTKSSKPETKIVKLFDFGTSTAIGITKGALTLFYQLERIASEVGGVAFQLTKAHDGSGMEPEVYHVLLHGIRTSCTCKGHSYRNKCKHVDALEALLKAGKIDVPAVQPQPAAPQEPETCWEPRCNRPAVNGPYCELHNYV